MAFSTNSGAVPKIAPASGSDILLVFGARWTPDCGTLAPLQRSTPTTMRPSAESVPVVPDICLVFPPGWTPFSPYLALPCLKAFVEERGHRAQIHDANLEFFDTILTSAWLARALSRCDAFLEAYNRRASLGEGEHRHYRQVVQALLLASSAPKIHWAKDVFRSAAFFRDAEYSEAKQIVTDCLTIASASYYGTSIRFNQIRLPDSYGCAVALQNVLGDDGRNPFVSFFRQFLAQLRLSGLASIVGISITSESQLLSALTLAWLLQADRTHGLHITLGGNYITRLASDWKVPNEVTRLVDSIALFEGESSLAGLADSVKRRSDFRTVKGLLYQHNDQLASSQPEIAEIRCLPTPNFDGFPLDRYLMPAPVFPIYTSRSCFAKCTFCTIPYASGGTFRTLKADQVFEQMQVLERRYGAQCFDIVDETVPLPTMRGLAALIAASQRTYKWYCETRFTAQYSVDVCRALFAGGCRKLQFGLESYSQRVLDLMKKQIRLDWIRPTLDACMEAGIAVHLFFMIGFPGETRAEAEQTVRFTDDCLKRARRQFGNPHWTRGWGQFSLEKHSDVYNRPEAYGVTILHHEHDTVVNGIPYETSVGMSVREAQELVCATRKMVQRLLEASGRFSFHTHDFNLNSEEESFLRICLSERSPQTESPRQREAGEIVTVPIRHPFLGGSASFAVRAVHYSPSRRLVWESMDAIPAVPKGPQWVLLKGACDDRYAYDVVSGRRVEMDPDTFAFVEALAANGTVSRTLKRLKADGKAARYSPTRVQTMMARALELGLLERTHAN